MPVFQPSIPTIEAKPHEQLPVFVLGPVGARQPTPIRPPTITIEERTPSGAITTTTRAAATPAGPMIPGAGAPEAQAPTEAVFPGVTTEPGIPAPDLPVIPPEPVQPPKPSEPITPEKWSPWIVGAIGLAIGLALAR